MIYQTHKRVPSSPLYGAKSKLEQRSLKKKRLGESEMSSQSNVSSALFRRCLWRTAIVMRRSRRSAAATAAADDDYKWTLGVVWQEIDWISRARSFFSLHSWFSLYYKAQSSLWCKGLFFFFFLASVALYLSFLCDISKFLWMHLMADVLLCFTIIERLAGMRIFYFSLLFFLKAMFDVPISRFD